MWLGRSQAPASSGLHHDFHDNLYILLRGRKRFRLFSPADAHKMYTCGRILRVHRNGLVNYVGLPPTSEDGREAQDVESDVAMAPRAEEALDDAMDGVVAAKAALRKASKRRQKQQTQQRPPAAQQQTPLAANGLAATSKARAADDTSAPPSFSRVGDLAGELDAIRAAGAETKTRTRTNTAYPRLAGARMATCELHAGEMLYLPAGWFHEVSSDGAGASGGLHCALNYWFHPPTHGRPFERPYRDGGFWEREWKRLKKPGRG